jgi:hypothetical protein
MTPAMREWRAAHGMEWRYRRASSLVGTIAHTINGAATGLFIYRIVDQLRDRCTSIAPEVCWGLLGLSTVGFGVSFLLSQRQEHWAGVRFALELGERAALEALIHKLGGRTEH